MNIEKKQVRLKMPEGQHLFVSEHNISSDFPLHWHSYFELEIALDGSGEYVINDVKYDISKNNVFFLTSADFHHVLTDKKIKILNVSFDEEYISKGDFILPLFSIEKAYAFSQAECEKLVKAIQLLQYECSIDGNYISQLLRYILTLLLRKNNPDCSGIYTNEHYSGINKAIVYMHMHFREKITLELLADVAGYNPTYFSELFKKITNETYIVSLNRLRVGYACTLLTGGFSVTEACFLSGFNSLSNFGTIFKKFCKISPSEYQKASRK